MNNKHQRFSRAEGIELGSVALILCVVVATLALVPATAFGQPTGTTTATPTTGASLHLSSNSGVAGDTITADGAGFQPGETVDVSINGQNVGSPTSTNQGMFSLSFTVPNFAPGDYGVLAIGRASGFTASAAFTIRQGGATLTFNPPQAAPGTTLVVTGAGFRPGEIVTLTFNGALIGSPTADVSGNISVTFAVPMLTAGVFGVTAIGQTSGVEVNTTYTILPGPTAVPTLAPTATPVPTAVPNAPPIVHDDRYFSQTGFRIDDDNIWNFFQQYGGIATFGYPTSRMMSFLGCPVQMFQRQMIQVCPSPQGTGLINLLDPEIFPYTVVNGSTFPAPDPTMKANTPQVGSPTYSMDIINFINQNVPDTWGGQPVNFQQHFYSTGGLIIWGAPISQPAPDPNNANFIYQRFQRGIMHFILGTGTESILLADYFKDILMGQNLPADLKAESQESPYYAQYCPGMNLWLCRPNDMPASDLTFAFVPG